MSQVQEKTDDYYRWIRDHEKAKADLSSAQIVCGVGWGVTFLSAVLYFTDKREEEVGYFFGPIYEEEYKVEYLFAMLGGGLITSVGQILSGNAKGNIRVLEEEGRDKGYLTAGIMPAAGGFVFSIAYRF